MHTTQKPIGLWSAVSMGVVAMVGAGIFALLGEASAIAGSAVYISFIAGGFVALSSAYSLGKLGAAFPSSGGIIAYISQSCGVGFFSGTMSIVLYLVRPAWARSWRCKSSRELTTANEVKRNCTRVTECGEEA